MKQCRFFTMLLVAATMAFSSCGDGGSGDEDGGHDDVVFLSAVQTGGTSCKIDSTGLTLTFSANLTTLTADNITVTGATKGVLSGTGTTWNLEISDISVTNEKAISISISKVPGYSIKDSTQTAMIYRALYIGMPYQGGIIAYILKVGDTGYDSNQTHGLIAAKSDQSEYIC